MLLKSALVRRKTRLVRDLLITSLLLTALVLGYSSAAGADEGDNRICVGSHNDEAVIVETSKAQTPNCTSLSVDLHDGSGVIDNWTDPTEDTDVKYCEGFSEYHNLTVNVCDVLETYNPIAWDLFEGSYSATSDSVNSQLFIGEAIGPVGNNGCTSAFLLEKDDVKYVSTAGHCIIAPLSLQPLGGYWSDTNVHWENESKMIGPARDFWLGDHFTLPWNLDGYQGNDFYDVGLIEVVDEATLQPHSIVFESSRDSSGNFIPGSKVPIHDFADPEVGMEVCMTGMTSGTSCGEVVEVSSTGFSSTVCSAGGDSGAGIYTKDGLAVGIHNGHYFSDDSECESGLVAFHSFVADLEDLGYSIAD